MDPSRSQLDASFRRRRILVTVIVAVALIACEETSDGSVTTTAEGRPALATDTGDVLDLSGVSVTGTGFDVDSDMMVAQCLAEPVGDDMTSACDLSRFAPVRSAGDGTLEAEVTVRTVIGTGKRLETDCLQTACVVGTGYIDDETVVAVAPIDWAADAEVPPPPVLTISGLQLDESANTGSAEVEGTGFMPGSTVSLVQCPKAQGGNGVDADDCLYDDSTVATADESGELDVVVDIYPRFQRSSGELIDCVSTPDLCVISEPWPQEARNRMSMVAFAAATG